MFYSYECLCYFEMIFVFSRTLIQVCSEKQQTDLAHFEIDLAHLELDIAHSVDLCMPNLQTFREHLNQKFRWTINKIQTAFYTSFTKCTTLHTNSGYWTLRSMDIIRSDVTSNAGSSFYIGGYAYQLLVSTGNFLLRLQPVNYGEVFGFHLSQAVPIILNMPAAYQRILDQLVEV